MRRICVTGPESTGKTTLARQVAEELGVPWVPEAARSYAERVGRPLTVDDVEPIAREHIATADAAAERSDGLIVLDTDLVSTVVYGREYYRFRSEWIEREAKARQADLYLLCDIDVPWVADGVRDLPHARARMFGEFLTELYSRAANVKVIRGTWEARLAAAMLAVRRSNL